MGKYKNFRCNAYHVYGDRSGKEWSYQELKNYFDITGAPSAYCTRDFIGDAGKKEFYKFIAGDYVAIRETFTGFEIR